MGDRTPAPLSDTVARDRFREAWDVNFAVAANAGSGKTTAISGRLAALALSPGGADRLRRTAVVTYTNKAAAQIGARARSVLLQALDRSGSNPEALDALERAFFGTIHSFCLMLAASHGRDLGIHLNPEVVDEEDDELWEEFLDQDVMRFERLSPAQVDGFLRHAPIDRVFDLARKLGVAAAERIAARPPAGLAPPPSSPALSAIEGARTKAGKGAAALQANKASAAAWVRRFKEERSFLPLPKPVGGAGGIVDLFADLLAPLKGWLAETGAVLAAELALRYRDWRFERGIQTYADQIEAALCVLRAPGTLERLRAEGWRVILDEAQDTDPDQFQVLVEITRPPGAPLGTWPDGEGAPPRPGHFSMVGDAQQSIYSSRADIRHFQRHLAAFARRDGGELLHFEVTFRAPRAVGGLLNATLPAAFGRERLHNRGLPPEPGAPEPLLQVPYEPLVAAPANGEGRVLRLPLAPCGGWRNAENDGLAEEASQIAAFLKAHGPEAVGARQWGEVCLLAPRNDWLAEARRAFEKAGLKTALQSRRSRNGDNPAYAWTCGLLAALCDPDNAYEWVGVLREVFAVSDAALAGSLRSEKRFRWDEPESDLPGDPVGAALSVLRPFIGRVEDEGERLDLFVRDLFEACSLYPKALLADPEGGLVEELDRLCARAAEAGLEGAGPRIWLSELLDDRETLRPQGRPIPDAINLVTSHSAKGLEWPVVLPFGLWKPLRVREGSGLRLLRGTAGRDRIVYDSEGIGADGRESGRRETFREDVRLLYVTLTRPRSVLVIPWGPGWVAGRKPRDGQEESCPIEESFLGLWGLEEETIRALPEAGPRVRGEVLATRGAPTPTDEVAQASLQSALAGAALRARPLPARPLPVRLLPHQLAHVGGAPTGRRGEPAGVDWPRAALHEATIEGPDRPLPGLDPVEYGVWWHRTMEFFPWGQGEGAVAAHGARALGEARMAGFERRGAEEWARFLASGVRARIEEARWTRLAELAVFAPVGRGAWIDGVMDLVLHDPAGREVWVVDWKTNRRRAGEGDEGLLGRLEEEYRPQLRAYGTCAEGFFPGCAVRLLVVSTAAGLWREIQPAGR